MGEILDFPKPDIRKNLTALGRFLMVVDEQERERRLQSEDRKNQPPTQAQIMNAHKELNLLFTGENQQLAEALYRQGLYDVVHQRTDTVSAEEKYRMLNSFTEEHNIEIFGAVGEFKSSQLTAAAVFYIHVETLTELANRAYDKPKG